MKHITDSLLAQAYREAFEAGKRSATLVADNKAVVAIGKAAASLDEERNSAGTSDNRAQAAINSGAAGGPPGSGGWQHHAEAMERERDHWRERAQAMHEHQRGEVWYWQGDGGDHLESMCNSLPVVIRADQLRALMAGQPADETMTLQEVWEAAGGNPGIKPTRDDVLLALNTLDEVCDEAAQQPAPATQQAGEVEGWLTWFRTPSGGREPNYSHGAKKPTHGAELDAILTKYPVFAAPQPSTTAQAADSALGPRARPRRKP